MTVGRRDLFGFGALGLGAVALDGCGGTRLPTTGAAMGPDEVDRLLTALDDVVAHVEAFDADPKRFGIQGAGAEVDAGRQRCVALLTTLCFMGTYRDVPETVWEEPRVAAHLARSLPRVRAVLADAREHLAAMSDAELAAIDQRLVKEPDLPMRIMERVDGYASELDVPIEQRTYLRLSTAQLAARFRYEGTREVTRKVTGTYGRVLETRMAELGVEEDDATLQAPTLRVAHPSPRPLGQGFLGMPVRPLRGEAGESCVTDEACVEGLRCMEAVCSAIPASKQIMDATRELAKWGGIFMIPPLCGIGVLMLLQCLFMTIVAGLVYAGEG